MADFDDCDEVKYTLVSPDKTMRESSSGTFKTAKEQKAKYPGWTFEKLEPKED